MKKVEWEKARGTDLAKLFPLVEEEASFMHTYLTIATAERNTEPMYLEFAIALVVLQATARFLMRVLEGVTRWD